MTSPQPTLEAQQQAEAHAPYLRIWGILLVLTVLEYFYARILAGHMTALIAGLMTMALVKAALVALYFMHVKFEGRWVYLLMAPVTFLAVVLVLALVPDMAYPSRTEAAPASPASASEPATAPAPTVSPATG